MGRGNVCVTGKNEGLYYIDNDYLHIYARYNEEDDAWETLPMGELSYEELTGADWKYDEDSSDIVWRETKEHLVSGMIARHPSFTRCDKWIGREEHAIAENNLIYVVVQDNEWSMAVKLIQKEHYFYCMDGIQRKHSRTYRSPQKISGHASNVSGDFFCISNKGPDKAYFWRYAFGYPLFIVHMICYNEK